MQNLTQIRIKTQWLKYIFLSASICIFVSLIVTTYVYKLPVDDSENIEPKKNIAKKLPKGYRLNINKSIFEGMSGDSLPYKIMAQNVIKNSSDKYLLDVVNGKYIIPSGEVTIKSDKATLDEITKSVILENDVTILFNKMTFNGKKIIVDLDTKDAKSEDEVTVKFKKSKIRADNFQTKDSAEIIQFNGNIDSNFDLDNF